MFFERFEDTDQNETTPQQRLEALKRKIAAKQKQPLTDTADHLDSVAPVSKENAPQNGEHPKKRRKISGTEENEVTKPKKKKKRKVAIHHDTQQECTRMSKKSEDIEVLDGNENDVLEPKKKRKKKKSRAAEASDYIDSDVASLGTSKSLKKNKDPGPEIKDEMTDPNNTVQASEDILCKKKKKGKKEKVLGDDVENLASEKPGLQNVLDPTCKESNGVVPGKKKKKKKQAVQDEETGLNNTTEIASVESNGIVQGQKKKKKKRSVEGEVMKNGPSGEAVAEQVCVGASETEIECHETAEKNSESAEPKEKEEEWTILGRHKTLKKVGHVKRDLPDWIVNCEIVDSDFDNVCTIADFGLLDECVVDVLKNMDIDSLFPVQSQIIPDVLSGCQKTTLLTRHLTPPSDICVSAPTGSGKTLVYVLSLVQCLYKLPPLLQAIVVVPTKNLANQVKQVFNNFNKLIKVALLSGKETFPTEQKSLYTEQGSCLAHVAVTTPGRLVNHLRETELFSLQNLRFLVIDEMDTLLNQTYQDWLPSLYKTVYNPEPLRHPMQPVVRTLRYTPDTPLSVAQLSHPALPLQKLLFSATVTHDPSKLAPLQLYRPRLYSCGGKYTLPNSLVQYQIRCQLEDKALVLVHLVRKLKHVLCFASSVDTSHRLAILTEEFGGMKVAEYSSTLTVQQRNKVMRDFSLGNIQLLVCSDSLARGMDISLVDHVINYDVPAHVQTYVHRVGRTARAGKVGHAYTLVRYEEIRHFHQLLKKAGDTRAAELKIPEESIAELSEKYQDCLQRLENRLKFKGKK